MSIVPSFDTGALRIRLKTAEDKVKAFESGEKYVQMRNSSRLLSANKMPGSVSWRGNLERPMRRRSMSGKYGLRYLMMFTRKQMQGNLSCAKRSHALSSASWKWNARGTTHWTG